MSDKEKVIIGGLFFLLFVTIILIGSGFMGKLVDSVVPTVVNAQGLAANYEVTRQVQKKPSDNVRVREEERQHKNDQVILNYIRYIQDRFGNCFVYYEAGTYGAPTTNIILVPCEKSPFAKK